MAVLCGFMIGSLYLLWPFQQDTTPEVEDFKHKVFQHFIPEGITTEVVTAAAVAVIALVAVLLLESIGRRTREDDI